MEEWQCKGTYHTFVVRIKWDDVHIQYTLLIIITMCLHGNSSSLQYSGLENSMDSILAWRIPWTIQSMQSQRVRHNWVTFTCTHTHSHTSWTRLNCGLEQKRTSERPCTVFLFRHGLTHLGLFLFRYSLRSLKRKLGLSFDLWPNELCMAFISSFIRKR